jgi:hypothetical protein
VRGNNADTPLLCTCAVGNSLYCAVWRVKMNEKESIRIGSIILVEGDKHEVIGFVFGKGIGIRLLKLKDDYVQLRFDLTMDDIELIKY